MGLVFSRSFFLISRTRENGLSFVAALSQSAHTRVRSCDAWGVCPVHIRARSAIIRIRLTTSSKGTSALMGARRSNRPSGVTTE